MKDGNRIELAPMTNHWWWQNVLVVVRNRHETIPDFLPLAFATRA